jgi:hypothetical protein
MKKSKLYGVVNRRRSHMSAGWMHPSQCSDACGYLGIVDQWFLVFNLDADIKARCKCNHILIDGQRLGDLDTTHGAICSTVS